MFCFGGVEAFSPFLLQCFLFIGVAMKGQNLSLSLSDDSLYFSIGVMDCLHHMLGTLQQGGPRADRWFMEFPYTWPKINGKLWLKPTPKYVELLGPYLSLVGAHLVFCFDSSKLQKKNTSIQRSTPPPSSPLGPLFAGELFVYKHWVSSDSPTVS